MKPLLRCASLLALSPLISCGSDDAASQPAPPARPGLFSSQVTQVSLEVDYQAGAEPFTTRRLSPGSPWGLTRSNLEALFGYGQPKQLTVPTQLDQMQQLPVLTQGPDFTAEEILEIAGAHRDQNSTDTSRTFHVVFLDGYLDQGGRRDNVLGVSLGDTGVVALFKPVYASLPSARFIEQTTLVHELGHAVGLVNNGVALASDHHDRENGAHCDNTDCVMFWQNEGAESLSTFITRFVNEDTTVLFGSECLGDIEAASE